MSTIPKGTTLRLIMPKDSSTRVMATLGPTAKVESRDTVLSGGRLTTDQMVSNIREYSRLRDELFHTIRQVGLTRNARAASSEPSDHATVLVEAREELDEKKASHQDLQSRIENLEKQIDEAKKQISRISEITQAGFSSADIAFAKGEFNRVIGRIPVRKVTDAQRSLQKLLGDQVVLALGNRAKDWVYILVAAPEEKIPQALQTILLYDFSQSEIPKSEEPDLKNAKAALETRVEELSSDLDEAKAEMKRFQDLARESLNHLADNIQDSLIQLQAVLKMGEGSQASRAFAWLAKTPGPKMLNSLSSQGALFETE